MTGTYIQMVGALAFVLLLIFGAAYFVRKKQNRVDLMSVISYQNIGPKKGVAALKIGKEVLILGVTTNEVRLLKTFQDNELDLVETGGFHSKLERFKKQEL
ncbi:MAG: FliO/MopB family protein [Candidatus Brocadiales bacterium]|nr:FliO/MopB family protein [Candidatus Brocadiales bacterium]